MRRLAEIVPDPIDREIVAQPGQGWESRNIMLDIETAAAYLIPPDHRILGAAQVAALGPVLEWVDSFGMEDEPIRDDLDILVAVIGDADGN